MSRARTPHLTETQERIVQIIRQAITDHGEAPTLQEIGEQLGLHSRGAVHYQLQQCVEKGALTRDRYRQRGIRLT